MPCRRSENSRKYDLDVFDTFCGFPRFVKHINVPSSLLVLTLPIPCLWEFLWLSITSIRIFRCVLEIFGDDFVVLICLCWNCSIRCYSWFGIVAWVLWWWRLSFSVCHLWRFMKFIFYTMILNLVIYYDHFCFENSCVNPSRLWRYFVWWNSPRAFFSCSRCSRWIP